MRITNLTSNQLNAIKAYVESSVDKISDFGITKTLNLSLDGFTFQLNGVLRANLKLAPEVEEYLRHIDGAFDEIGIPNSLTVYRSCNYLEMLRYVKNGFYFDHGYMSTSKALQTAQKFFQSPSLGYMPAFLKIEIPAGSSVLDLDNIDGYINTTSEGEVLIKRYSQFRVIYDKEVEITDDLVSTIGVQAKEDFDKIRILELAFMKYFYNQ